MSYIKRIPELFLFVAVIISIAALMVEGARAAARSYRTGRMANILDACIVISAGLAAVWLMFTTDIYRSRVMVVLGVASLIHMYFLYIERNVN